MGNIGRNQQEFRFEPMPETEAIKEPAYAERAETVTAVADKQEALVS